MEVILQKSILPSEQYTAIIGKKSIRFGAAGYEDYTMHKDNKRKELYI